jgi:hypothetical protein
MRSMISFKYYPDLVLGSTVTGLCIFLLISSSSTQPFNKNDGFNPPSEYTGPSQAVENPAGPTRSPVSARGSVDLLGGASPNEVLVFEKMRVPRWLAETVVRAAQVTNVDPAYLMALADKESSFLPDIKARTSSAEGLFQFIESTWLEVLRRYGPKHGYAAEAEAIQMVRGRPVVSDPKQREAILSLRRDPYLSALIAGEMMTTHREILAGKVARDPSFTELYMAHFLGLQGASHFVALLGDMPGTSAPEAFPSAAKANRTLFFTSSKEAVRSKSKALSVAEVHGRIDAMIDKRVVRYASVRQDLGPVQGEAGKFAPSPSMVAQVGPGAPGTSNLPDPPLPPAIEGPIGSPQTYTEARTDLPLITREAKEQDARLALASAVAHVESRRREHAATGSPLAGGAVAPQVKTSTSLVARVTSTATAHKAEPMSGNIGGPRSPARVKVASLGPVRGQRVTVVRHPVQKESAYQRELKLAQAQVSLRHSLRTAADSKRFWAAHEERIRVLTKKRMSS